MVTRSPIKGGKSVALCDVKDPGTVTASWTADDRIIYAQSGEGIMQVSTENGIPETLIREEDNNIFFKPHLLPDGNSILYTLFTNGNFEVVVQSLKSDERKISFLGSGAWYLSTGYLVYTMGNNLFAVPFDLDRLEIGDPVSMDRPVYRTGVYPPQYAVSDSGTLVYVPYFIGRREQKITTVVNWFEELKQKVPVQ